MPAGDHTVMIELGEEGPQTRVSPTQDNNPSEDACEHSQKNWEPMLKGLKQYVEQ